MIPLLGFHALAATRGEGLRPELLALLERLAADAERGANGPGRPSGTRDQPYGAFDGRL
jgi:hypothetical protein